MEGGLILLACISRSVVAAATLVKACINITQIASSNLPTFSYYILILDILLDKVEKQGLAAALYVVAIVVKRYYLERIAIKRYYILVDLGLFCLDFKFNKVSNNYYI